ncbi:hypothetical protein M758_9G166800 [Ceratodon purpureus]|nr:hypothetical protein M758_9G166800 [Ceratodon purpureus]
MIPNLRTPSKSATKIKPNRKPQNQKLPQTTKTLQNSQQRSYKIVLSNKISNHPNQSITQHSNPTTQLQILTQPNKIATKPNKIPDTNSKTPQKPSKISTRKRTQEGREGAINQKRCKNGKEGQSESEILARITLPKP